MDSKDIREKFLDYFKLQGHISVKSSSLLSDDPSVLLTTAGMQQFKPYYTGEKNPLKDVHPGLGKPLGSVNVASVQKCFRTSDIDEVGDESHLTFFEMLGNFSFGLPFEALAKEGGYWKKQAIEYAYDLLVNVYGINPKDLTISYFGGGPQLDSKHLTGQGGIPEDKESKQILENYKNKVLKIEARGKEDNFWGPTGKEGPCGPTVEFHARGVELWNLVFNEYYCKSRTDADGTPNNAEYELNGLRNSASSQRVSALLPLATKGVDTGAGFERIVAYLQKKPSVFETDLFEPIISKLKVFDVRTQRIIADHVRGITFLIADGVLPSNKEAGYILRRLIRRVYIYLRKEQIVISNLVKIIINFYSDIYPELKTSENKIISTINEEIDKFEKTLNLGMKKLDELINKSIGTVDGKSAFMLFSSLGMPVDYIKDKAKDKKLGFNKAGFEDAFQTHQEVSRAGVEAKFGGHGLLLNTGELKAGTEEEVKKVTRLHTATHLLQQALREVLGPHVEQRGSDITPERTRFDFTNPQKLTAEEVKRVENLVNEKIKESLPVKKEEMKFEEAVKQGARAFFKDKYPEIVSVYSIGGFSKELCGGPHVSNTKEIGKFKIIKEESVSSGIRRIRAIVE